MGKKRKSTPRETPEERAAYERSREMLAERIAYHEAKAREEEDRQAQAGQAS